MYYKCLIQSRRHPNQISKLKFNPVKRDEYRFIDKASKNEMRLTSSHLSHIEGSEGVVQLYSWFGCRFNKSDDR